MIVFRRDHDHAIARLDGRTQSTHRFGCVLGVIILVVERNRVQRENVERSPGPKGVLKTAKHRGAIGGAAQAAGEAEKRELGHRGRGSKWLGLQQTTRGTSRRRRSSSSKFDFRFKRPVIAREMSTF